mmetsp:Transcript_5557/g.16579  ORF Transcript_5557/g.16579 Transcript_5557/m.16579 type:complete len:634 (-) Transcript_5557:221-2122(-)
MGPQKLRITAALLLTAVALTDAFYIPGIPKAAYTEGAKLEVTADRLTSSKNQLPYEYFYLPFCRSDKTALRKQGLNIGEILLGERNQVTDYDLRMQANEMCKIYCRKKFVSDDIKRFMKRIKDEYYVRLNVDNMPALSAEQDDKGTYQVIGFRLGDRHDDKYYIYNHLTFRIKVHNSEISGDVPMYRVVGFEVEPQSVRHEMDSNGTLTTCPVPLSAAGVPAVELDTKNPAGQEIIFTYDVIFKEDPNLAWGTRWDPLLRVSEESRSLQRLYIFNSLSITLFLTILVGIILTRTVYLDYARYNNIDSTDEVEIESGWKQVHGDVFRAPDHKELLVILVGNGAQIALIVFVTLSFALLGFWSPAYRGGLLTALIFMWILTSALSGFCASKLYSEMGGTKRRLVTLGSCFLFSGALFTVFFLLNIMLTFAQSSAAVNFFTLLKLIFFWLALSVPLNVLGSFLGYREKVVDPPCKPNPIPREIPQYAPVSPYVFSLVSGIMPFGVVFVELVYILESLWQHGIFFMFGFLYAVFVLLVVTCIEVSLVVSYLILSKEDYRWWWTSFLSSGSSGLYVLAYSFFYLLSRRNLRQMPLASVLLYTGYSSLISLGFTLMTGALGFLASKAFVRRMFNVVRLD